MEHLLEETCHHPFMHSHPILFSRITNKHMLLLQLPQLTFNILQINKRHTFSSTRLPQTSMFTMVLFQTVRNSPLLVQKIREVTTEPVVDPIRRCICNINQHLCKTHTQQDFIRYICSPAKWGIRQEWYPNQ